MANLNDEWTCTNMNPHYFVKDLGDGDFEAISVCVTGHDGLIVSSHDISIGDIPADEFEELKSEITLEEEDIKIKYTIGSALGQGYGEEKSLGHFEKEEISELNDLIASRGIETEFTEFDFSC